MDGIHSMQILYKGDNGELLLFFMFSWQHFATAASPPFPPAPPCTTLAMVSYFVCSMKSLPPTEMLPQLSIESRFCLSCVCFGIYTQKLYPVFWLHLLEDQIMLSCLWKKSTPLDLPLQDSLWTRSVLLGWSSWKLRFKLSFKMSV